MEEYKNTCQLEGFIVLPVYLQNIGRSTGLSGRQFEVRFKLRGIEPVADPTADSFRMFVGSSPSLGLSLKADVSLQGGSKASAAHDRDPSKLPTACACVAGLIMAAASHTVKFYSCAFAWRSIQDDRA